VRELDQFESHIRWSQSFVHYYNRSSAATRSDIRKTAWIPRWAATDFYGR
jgi:hypothetical protein